MPRANRHFLSGHVWHITHRCHQRAFLLKFARDRGRYLRWLFEAKKRFGLCVLNYTVTSNHVHLLVQDTSPQVIARSMQLVAGRSAQEYNQRKSRQGAFWEDRYHATAIESDAHLHRCVVYVDLNMVRAGVVTHPAEWVHSGYREIQAPPQRYAIINLERLMSLCGFTEVAAFQRAHRQWVEDELARGSALRDERWSASIAVGSLAFVDRVRSELAVKALHRGVAVSDTTYVLREPGGAYMPGLKPETGPLSPDNTVFWDQNSENSEP
jgi:putative transposase